jgi:hypothetical protein
MPACAVCRLAAATPQVCGACNGAMYCGVACQAEDWKHRGHARQCADLARATRVLPPAHHHLLVAAHRAHCAAAGARRGTNGVPALQTDPLPSIWQTLPDELLMFMTRDIDSPDDLSALITILTRPPLVAPPPTLPVQEFAAARVGPTGRGALMEALLRLRLAPLYVPPPGTPVGAPPPPGAWGLRRIALFADDNTVSWQDAGRTYWPVENIEARLAATYLPPAGFVLRAGWMQDVDPDRARGDPDSFRRALGRPPSDEERAIVATVVPAVRRRAVACATTGALAAELAIHPPFADDATAATAANGAWIDYAWTLPELKRHALFAPPDYTAATIGAAAVNVGGSLIVAGSCAGGDCRAFDLVTAVSRTVVLRMDDHTLTPDTAPLPALLVATSVSMSSALRDARGLLPALVSVVADVDVSQCNDMESFRGAFEAMAIVGLNLYVRGNVRLSRLDGCFPALRAVGGTILVMHNDRLLTLGRCFPTLARTNSVMVYKNATLANLDDALPSLLRIGGTLYICSNAACATMTNAFPSLVSAGTVKISNNAALVSLDGTLGALVRLYENLSITDNPELARIGTGFAALREVDDAFHIERNERLQTLARAFPALHTVSWKFHIRANAQLHDAADAFPVLRNFEDVQLQPMRIQDAFASLSDEGKRRLEKSQ